MKKLISLLLVVMLMATLFAGCGGNEDSSADDASTNESSSVEENSSEESSSEEDSSSEDEITEDPYTFKVGGLKGPTSIGMVKLMKDSENGETEGDYEFTMAAAADELSPKFIKGEIDIISGPVNLCSILYNKTEGNAQFLAVNTLGVLYVVQKGGDAIESIADLKGKTIYATGKGTTPEYTLRYLLTENGLDPDADITIEWKSEPTEIVGLMAQDETAIAMMPQPFVTVAQNQIAELKIALDLTEEWNKLDNGTAFITAGLVIRADVAEKYPQQLAKFLEEYKASTEYVNANVEEAATLCEEYGIVKAAIATKAIPYCNITCVQGEEMKTMASGYLKVLFDQNPTSVGGALPEDKFYYGVE